MQNIGCDHLAYREHESKQHAHDSKVKVLFSWLDHIPTQFVTTN